MIKAKHILLAALPAILASCGGEESQGFEEKKKDLRDELKQVELSANKVVRFDKSLFSIPSPFQTSLLIQKLGVGYKKDLLSGTRTANDLTATFDKALNLGVYGSDLSYAIIYDQPQDAINYLNTVNKLGNEIGVSGAFDKTILNRIEQNIGNKDSLIHIISLCFKESDSYLKRNDQKLASTLLIVGGWIEGVYIAAEIYKEKSNPEIAKRIAEQKNSLENLLHLLIPLKEEEPKIEGLLTDLQDLSIFFRDVKLGYTFVDPTTNEDEKITYINSKSKIEITKPILDNITEKINSIRTKIVTGNV